MYACKSLKIWACPIYTYYIYIYKVVLLYYSVTTTPASVLFSSCCHKVVGPFSVTRASHSPAHLLPLPSLPSLHTYQPFYPSLNSFMSVLSSIFLLLTDYLLKNSAISLFAELMNWADLSLSLCLSLRWTWSVGCSFSGSVTRRPGWTGYM